MDLNKFNIVYSDLKITNYYITCITYVTFFRPILPIIFYENIFNRLIWPILSIILYENRLQRKMLRDFSLHY